MHSRARALVLVTLGAGILPWIAAADDRFDREYDLATRMILCDCGCSPQSAHDCACGRATEMRDEIAGTIRGGKTGQQVIDAYVAKYGDKIRIAPAASGFNLLAWLGPGIALLAGVMASVLILRRWKHASAAREAGPAAPPSPADDPYVARIRDQLREYE